MKKFLVIAILIGMLAGCNTPSYPPNPLPGAAWTVSPTMNGLTSITFADQTNWTSGATAGTYTYEYLLVHIFYPTTDVYYAPTILDAAHHVTLYHGPVTYDLTR
jgi:hypothetical protein